MTADPSTEEVLDYIMRHPGKSFREITKCMHIHPGPLMRSLSELESKGIIEQRHMRGEDPRTPYYYHVKYVGSNSCPPDRNGRILEIVAARPYITVQEVSEIVGLSNCTTNNILRRMTREGLLVRTHKSSKKAWNYAIAAQEGAQ